MTADREVASLTRAIPLREITMIMLSPESDAPSIAYWLTNGETVLNVFTDQTERDDVWNVIEDGLSNEDFLTYHDTFISIRAIATVDAKRTEAHGSHILFLFHSGKTFIQQYDDEETMRKDLLRVVEILSVVQDLHVVGTIPKTRQ